MIMRLLFEIRAKDGMREFRSIISNPAIPNALMDSAVTNSVQANSNLHSLCFIHSLLSNTSVLAIRLPLTL